MILSAPRIEYFEELQIVGRQIDISFTKIERVSELWQTFDNFCSDIKNQTGDDDYGVSFNNTPDGFTYIAGRKVSTAGKQHADLSSVIIPAGNYAVFDYRGPKSGIADAWATIMTTGLSDAKLTQRNSPQFEICKRQTEPQSTEIDVQICVPIVPQ